MELGPKDFSTGKGQFAETYSHYQLVHPGDFAMNHMDLLTGWVDISRYEGVTSPDYRVFSARDLAVSNPSYYLYLFQMCYLNRVFFGSANGVADKGRMRLQTNAFNNFVVPLPPFRSSKKDSWPTSTSAAWPSTRQSHARSSSSRSSASTASPSSTTPSPARSTARRHSHDKSRHRQCI